MKIPEYHIKFPVKRAQLFLLGLSLLSLNSLQLSGQEDNATKELIVRKFKDYVHNVPREEVFVQTDRESYISGEDIWFTVYVTDRETMFPRSDSRVVYFEILNPDNRPVIQRKIGITDGFGTGQAELLDSLSSGTYIIRAYTSRMKNFLPDNCFIKSIRIYNQDNSKMFMIKSDLRSDDADEGETDGVKLDAIRQVTMRPDNSGSDKLNIFISAENELLTRSGNRFLLFIETHGVIDYAEYTNIVPGGVTVAVPKEDLSSGINHLTLFDPAGNPVSEKYIYTKDQSPGNVIRISCDSSFGRRSQVKIMLDISNSGDTMVCNSNLSISVSLAEDQEVLTSQRDYMVFGSEFGQAPHSLLKETKIDDLDNQALNNLLTNLRTRWINWNKILTGKIPRFKYQFENDYYELKGNLVESNGKSAPLGEKIFLSIPGKIPVFQYATTDPAGSFSFPVHIDESIRDLILQPAANTGNFRIRVESPFSGIYPEREVSILTSPPKSPDFISDWSVTSQVRKIYGIQSWDGYMVSRFSPDRPVRFYGKPDQEFVMDDYIILPDMEEVFFEIIRYVALKKKRNGYEISMIDPTGQVQFEGSPASFIDGVLVNDADKIAALNPEQVEKVDVIMRKYLVGDHLFNGIVNIITRKGNFENIAIPENAIRVFYRPLDQVRNFSSPDYSVPGSADSRIPDLRNTLYWNPGVPVDEKGRCEIKFWTADIRSDFVINIQGLTRDGKYVSVRKTFRVE